MNKKILFITSNFLPNKLTGSEEFIKNLSQLLNTKGLDVTVLTHRGSDFNYVWNPFQKKLKKQEVIKEIKIVRLKNNHLKNFFILFIKMLIQITKHKLNPSIPLFEYINLYTGPQFIGLKKFLKMNKYDVIHVGPAPYEYVINTVKLVKSSNLNSLIITTPFIHETQRIYLSKIFKSTYRAIDRIHTVTNHETNLICKNFGIKPFKIRAIPLFLNLENFCKTEELVYDTIKFKNQYNLHKKFVILGIGGENNAKGFEYTFEACKILSKKYSNLVLISIGSKSSLDTSNINFEYINLGWVLGKQKDIVFNSCDVFCMPSKVDSFGLVYLEAWLRKKPICALKLPAIYEVLNGGSLFIDKLNSENTAEVLEKIIKNSKFATKLGEEGYKILMDKYTSKSVYEKYSNLFFN